ncbi:hypothetical protein Cni_G15270 [Canna indica]|uniref:G protein gamma domain-containing protein n=1 Tax=Canna indica TaxID=4628 RepID=A0AAQ3KJ87_9LILI|nr:hypothetical protein Cni_G15270 [Canna indica]
MGETATPTPPPQLMPPVVVVVAPSPKSPPRYPDLCGRRRLQLELQILNREIGFLEEELQSLEGIQHVSRWCKQVNDFVGLKPDPLMPMEDKFCILAGQSFASTSHQFAASVGVCLSLKSQVVAEKAGVAVNVDALVLDVVRPLSAAVAQEIFLAVAVKHVAAAARVLPAVAQMLQAANRDATAGIGRLPASGHGNVDAAAIQLAAVAGRIHVPVNAVPKNGGAAAVGHAAADIIARLRAHGAAAGDLHALCSAVSENSAVAKAFHAVSFRSSPAIDVLVLVPGPAVGVQMDDLLLPMDVCVKTRTDFCIILF